MLSWITGIATLLLATSTLIIKWAILKPIHEEIVEKFKKAQPIFFKQHSICRIIDLRAEFNLFTFPLACFIILLFTITTKRVSFQGSKYCKGYIGIPIPLDIFAHVKRILAAVIFAIFADELLDIANDALNGSNPSSNQGVVIVYLLQILRVFVIGFRCYPTLAAVYIDTWFSLICATLYVWFDFSITIVYTGLCRNDFYPSEADYNKTKGAYISIKLPILLYERIRHRHMRDKKLTCEQKTLLYSSLPYSIEAQYVKKLFGMSNIKVSTNRFSQTFQFIYAWRDDFRFSSRVVSFCVQVPPSLDVLRKSSQQVVNLLSKLTNSSDPNLQADENPSSDFPLPDFVRSYLIAFIAALFITLVQLLVMFAGIRRNLLQAFRGDDSEIPRRLSSENINYITGTFHFAGYLIGYVILAYIFLAIFLFIILISIDALITYGNVKFLETILKIIIPTLILVFFKMYLNKILGQYIFLQHDGEVLSINNRRAFMVFIYFNFFLDAFLGFVAAITRILRSIAGGVLYMCRLDYSPLGRKLETIDSGFSAYCGFIFVECAHRHPVLLYFVSHLLRNHLYPTNTKRLSKARHKWYVAIFLLNNPTLIYRRKQFLTRLQENDLKMMLIGRNNMKELYIEQPPILAHRASVISAKDLEDMWERRKF
ncbi:unnamed protein product [Rotaria sordida]|uniref:Receptor for retinol uptake STRA6 n=1 Tax=Rotaria sordida TaxID=392033 RepID=A0A815GFB3_9BILA|nr:unnamed protein product [Rotaria sordida]CAF3931190.1 unnamed protein product [Rotaria sordida]